MSWTSSRDAAAVLEFADLAAASTVKDQPVSDLDEQGFRLFYDRTAGPLRAYLMGSCGNPTLADDLLQESYFRLIRSGFEANDEEHRKNYLFRIATNLLRDHYRRRRPESPEIPEIPNGDDHGSRIAARTDLVGVLKELKPRQRELLWLAYVEGMSHREIADALGLKTASIRPLLFRARQRMLAVMKSRGLSS
jgi:RNA polymerase sigma-70 factor (ECF subfamily)